MQRYQLGKIHSIPTLGQLRSERLKAFLVTYEDGARIAFSSKAEGSDLWEDFDYVESVKREHRYDVYANLGYVPAEILHKDGWTLPCDECYSMFDVECWDYEEDRYVGPPVYDGTRFWCCQECHFAWESRATKNKKVSSQVKACIRSMYPRAYEISIWGETCNFKLPGMVGKVEWRFIEDPSHVYVLPCDIDLFKRLYPLDRSD